MGVELSGFMGKRQLLPVGGKRIVESLKSQVNNELSDGELICAYDLSLFLSRFKPVNNPAAGAYHLKLITVLGD